MKAPSKPPDDPVRLGAQAPELQRALVALADAEAPSSAELRRMRQRLTVVFESPAPRHGPLLRLARGPVGKVIAGAVVLAGAVAVLRTGQPHTSALPAPSHPADPVVIPRQDVPNTPAESAAPTLQAEPPVSLPIATRHAIAKPHHIKMHGPTNVAPHALEPAAVGGEDMHAATSVAPAASPPAPEAAPASTPSAAAPERPTTKPPASAAVSTQLDEAALLQRARQLASSDPDAALRLLEQHRQRFGHGMLSPEREVFTIELLRSLSRTQEAAQRLEAFRRSYPGSVYLKRLD